MFFTIYKTTNKINNKFYIGKHQTLKLIKTLELMEKFLGTSIEEYMKEISINTIIKNKSVLLK